ncbi:GNAT family N-acetyltransferase [Paenibacillus elgii]
MDIVRLTPQDRKSLMALYKEVTTHLKQSGVYQWDWLRFVIGADVKQGTGFGVREGDRVIGAVVVDRRQSGNYGGLPWTDRTGDPACIHRLAVHPARRIYRKSGRCRNVPACRLCGSRGNPISNAQGAVPFLREAAFILKVQ